MKAHTEYCASEAEVARSVQIGCSVNIQRSHETGTSGGYSVATVRLTIQF